MLEFIEKLARGAGEILTGFHGKLAEDEIGFKGRNDLQTKADLASEKYLISRIHKQFPEDSIYSEESEPTKGRTDRWWFIDPLDGTTNFAHGLPIYGVSIGVWDSGQMRWGAVYLPYLDEMFIGERGKGAWLNEDDIAVSDTADLEHAVVGTGFTYRRAELTNNNLADFASYAVKVQGIRRLGSASADMCYVACGRLDAYWEAYLGPFDSAAASVILREAGGTVSDYQGDDDWLFGENILVSNTKLHGEFVGKLQPLDAGTTNRYWRPEMT